MLTVTLVILVTTIAITMVTRCLSVRALSGNIVPQPCPSDAEFCALMPDVSEETALKVRGVLAAATGWDRDEIHPHTRLVEFELW